MGLLQLNGAQVDLDTGQTSEGRRLPATELALLAFLAAHPGEELSSARLLREVWGALRLAPEPDALEHAVERLRLRIERDPQYPEHLVTAPGGYRFVPLRSSLSSVPRPARALLGRQEELSRALELLLPSGGLVTLVGAAGVGKTRLAAELAERWLHRGHDAIWVDLEPCRDEHDLLQVVAWQLGDSVEISALGVGRALARRGPLLVVLDNAEHLPREAAVPIATWVRGVDTVRLCVTSRAPLGLPEERLVPVEPLPMPGQEQVFASVPWRLFAAAAPAGQLDPPDPAQALAVLARLDGLPLAIELAAARLEVLPLGTLIERLADPLTVLVDPDRPGTRGGALSAAIQLSWDALTPLEQRVMGCVATFVSPADLQAIEVVADQPVLDTLHTLVRRSMVHRSGERLLALPSTRAFVTRALDSSVREALVYRHAQWLALEADTLSAPRSFDDPALRARARQLAPELMAVISRAADAPALQDFGVRCAMALGGLMDLGGASVLQQRVAEAGLALGGRPEQRTWLQWSRAQGLRRQGKLMEARQALQSMLAGPLERGPRANALAYMGDLATECGEHGAAEVHYREVLALLEQEPGEQWRSLAPLVTAALATVVFLRDPPGAHALLARARTLPEAGRPQVELELRKVQAWLYLEANDERAGPAYAAVAEMASQMGLERVVAVAVGGQGISALWARRFAEALPQLQEAADRILKLGDAVYASYYRGYAAVAAVGLGQVDRGLEELRAVLAEISNPGIAKTLRETLHRVETATWTADREGAWFEPPGGPRIETGTHRAQQRILAALVRARLDAPGESLDVVMLGGEGWPGERLSSEVLGNRVRVALSALRKRGLALQRGDGGWRLDPTVPWRIS